MQKIILFFTLVLVLSCGSAESQDSSPLVLDTSTSGKETQELSTLNTNPKRQKDNKIVYQESTYDDPKFISQIVDHQNNLKRLSDNKIFSNISLQLLSRLNKTHQKYFKNHAEFELLSAAEGNLFRGQGKDAVFFVYDKIRNRGVFLVYHDNKNRYFQLFTEIQVVNGLEGANCNYGNFGSLDYRFSEVLIEQEEYLTKNPYLFLKDLPIKITDFRKDKDFVLKEGCFAKTYIKNEISDAFCISTSSVYNNWECLRYDKSNNTFNIFYGQAFAD
ncbi:hypothetical protein FNJ88_10915 [Chryseobacterium sp. SNU WT5]|uniref:hypothetical protein n=1 Tax=Chryseobacterium sp. SNU WT5 TaxID=2594269 RepID=UPI00117E7F06|nr:hypothetical protein [Chryseobacterium sp. SNU WT5]QDP86029.1 hypothetical protein FNJ88_10915 [Chryseobacterium sp. SNU WT5]